MTTTKKTLLMLALAALVFAPALAQFRDPLPVPDVAGFRTLKCDFHMHTVFSDGQVWPTTRVQEAWREGLDVIAITDHAGYNPFKDDVRPDLSRPYQIAVPLAERLGIILVPGLEVMQGDTHFNLLFVNDPNSFFDLKLADALRAAHARGAFIFWNHPGWKQPADWFADVAELYKEKPFHGVELINGLDVYPQAFAWIEPRKLAIMANSDVHTPTLPTYAGRRRPLTLVFAKTADLEGVREALFDRRTVGWVNGELWGAEEWLRGLWVGAVEIARRPISLSATSPQGALALINRSAIPFRLRPLKTPSWLRLGGGELSAEGGVGLVVSITKDAPAGQHQVEVEIEISNMHVAPGRNLVIRLPLVVNVS